MIVKEVDLPGVGKKYTVEAADGDTFIIITYHTGRREIYIMQKDEEDEPLCTLNLSNEEARRVGSILLGADYQPVSDEKMDLIMQSLFIEWLRIGEDSPLANLMLKESGIKETTGATIIGIQRKDEMIVNPEAEQILLPQDLLMVVGKREQLRLLTALCKDQNVCKD